MEFDAREQAATQGEQAEATGGIRASGERGVCAGAGAAAAAVAAAAPAAAGNLPPPARKLAAGDLPPAIKPRMRGVLHSYAAVGAATAGALLVAQAPSMTALWVALVYALVVVSQFVISGIYHTGDWSRRPIAYRVLRRLDHSVIYLNIAATHTPLLMLPLGAANAQLAGRLTQRIWLGAAAGIGKTWVWPGAPPALSALVYLALGWSAVPAVPLLAATIGTRLVWLVATGGLLYSVGALAFYTRWPNPWPAIFGYHEVFHVFTLLASVLHFICMWQVVVKAELMV